MDVADDVANELEPRPEEKPLDPLHRCPFGQQAYFPESSSIQYSPEEQLPEPSGQHVSLSEIHVKAPPQAFMPSCCEQGLGLRSVVVMAVGTLCPLNVPTVAVGSSVWNQLKVSVSEPKYGKVITPPSPTHLSPIVQQPYFPLPRSSQ